MNPLLKKWALCVIAAMLLSTLCGCRVIDGMKKLNEEARQASEANQAKADGFLEQMMTFVQNRDAAGAAAISDEPEKMMREFPGFVSDWPVRATDAYELRSLNTTFSPDQPGGFTAFVQSAGQNLITIYSYHVHCDDGDYEVRVGIRPFDDEEKMQYFDVVSVQSLLDQGIEPAGTKYPVARKSFVQWLLLAIWILSIGFSIFTVVDLIRRKPKLYGLWIPATLLFVIFVLNMGPAHTNNGINFGILSPSYWMRFQGGESRIRLALPVGSIVYWIVRRWLPKRNPPAEPTS